MCLLRDLYRDQVRERGDDESPVSVLEFIAIIVLAAALTVALMASANPAHALSPTAAGGFSSGWGNGGGGTSCCSAHPSGLGYTLNPYNTSRPMPRNMPVVSDQDHDIQIGWYDNRKGKYTPLSKPRYRPELRWYEHKVIQGDNGSGDDEYYFDRPLDLTTFKNRKGEDTFAGALRKAARKAEKSARNKGRKDKKDRKSKKNPK